MTPSDSPDLTVSRITKAPPSAVWTAWKDRQKHREVGFVEGWGKCIAQLAAVAVRSGQRTV